MTLNTYFHLIIYKYFTSRIQKLFYTTCQNINSFEIIENVVNVENVDSYNKDIKVNIIIKFDSIFLILIYFKDISDFDLKTFLANN
jgi:hypothetical protein